MSVIGPQKRLWQYAGVAKPTTVGGWAAIDAEIVVWCSSGLGTRPPAAARESRDAGETPGLLAVRLSLGMAASPTAGMAWRSPTWKLVSAWRCLPSTVAITWVCQMPALSKAAWAVYTPLGPDGEITSGAVLSGATWV